MKDIFNNINSELISAEVKNGILFGVSGILFFALFNIVVDGAVTGVLIPYMYIALLFLSLATLGSIISFFPMNINSLKSNRDKPTNEDNILRFGDIKNYNKNEYLTKLSEIDQFGSDANSLFGNYMAEQIITNSIIVFRKLRFFYASLLLLLSALIAQIFGIFVTVIAMFLF